MIDPVQAGKLKAIAAKRDVLSAGSIQLVGLNDIRSHFEDRWPEVRDRVFRHAHNAIKAHLAEDDVCIRVGDDGFMFILDDDNPDRAERLSEAASDSIKQRLLGADAVISDKVSPQPRTFPIDTDDLSSVMESAADVFTDAFSERMHAANAPEAADDEDTLILDEIEEVEPEPERKSLADRAKDLPPMPMPKIEKPVTAYQPVWTLGKNAVIEFMARPVGEDSGTPPAIFGLADTGEARKEALELDLRTISDAGGELKRLELLASRLQVCACICASSFTNQTFSRQIAEELLSIPKERRQLLRILVFEIRIGAQSGAVRYAIEMLRPLVGSVGLVTRIDEKRMSRIAQLGYDIVGVDLETCLHLGEGPAMKLLESFSAAARRLELPLMVLGLDTRSLASFAACSGAALLGGVVIGPPADKVPQAVRYEPLHIYEDLAKRRMA